MDGVLHLAGVVRDNFILKKTEREFREVLAPKLQGAMNLDLEDEITHDTLVTRDGTVVNDRVKELLNPQPQGGGAS